MRDVIIFSSAEEKEIEEITAIFKERKVEFSIKPEWEAGVVTRLTGRKSILVGLMCIETARRLIEEYRQSK